MKVRVLLTLAGAAISFAVPAFAAQDAMIAVAADEVVWKEHPAFILFEQSHPQYYLDGRSIEWMRSASRRPHHERS
jgi:hypothetical protein